MPIFYAIAFLIAVVLIVAFAFAFVTRARSRKLPSHSQSSATKAPKPAELAPILTRTLQDQASFDNSDPDATQMYLRPSKTGSTTEAQKRAGTAVSGARLVGLAGSQKGQHFALTDAGLTVGRNPSCEIVLGDARVSGQHAWIGLVNGKAVLRDLNSSNGTFLNTGARVTGDTELCAGDTIFIGGHQGDQFRFVAG